MKNIEQILADAGVEVTEEQKSAITKGLAENYKTLADYDKQKRKLETAETDRDNLKQQLEDAQETLKGFDGVDVAKMNKDIEEWKKRAETAEKDAEQKILRRDQSDWLKQKLGAEGYDVKSPRVRKSLMQDIMDTENGLKWKDGQFLGLDDYMKSEKEKDPTLYLTQEEKEAEKAGKQAATEVPKFTDKADGKQEPAKETKVIPKIW